MTPSGPVLMKQFKFSLRSQWNCFTFQIGPNETVSLPEKILMILFHFPDRSQWNCFTFQKGPNETVLVLKLVQEVKQFHWDRSRRCNSFIRTEIKNETVSLGQFQNFKQFHLFRIIKNETVSSVPLYHFRNWFIQPPPILCVFILWKIINFRPIIKRLHYSL